MKKFKFIVGLALPYVLTVVLPIISIFTLGSMVTTNYHNKIIADKQKNVELAFESFLQKMSDIETLSFMLAENQLVTSYAYGALRGAESTVIDTMEIRDLFRNFLINNDVTTIYLYDSKQNRIITPSAVYSNASDYFRYVYCQEGFTPQESVMRLNRLFWGYEYSTEMKVSIEGAVKEVIEYRVSTLLGVKGRGQPQLILVMNVKDIFSEMFDVAGEGGEFYVYDRSGRLMYASGSKYEGWIEQEIVPQSLQLMGRSDEEVYGMACSSDDELWNLEIYLPKLMSGGLDFETRQAWVWLGIALAASIIFCTYFTFRNHREIQEILGLFTNRKQEDEEKVYLSGSGYKVIKNYAGKFVDENNKFMESIPQLENSRKYEVFDKLLRNTYESQEEMWGELSGDAFNFPTGKCAVICIRYKGSSYRTYVSQNVTAKAFVKDKLNMVINQKYEIFDTSAKETVCVLAVDDSDMNVSADEIISKLNVEVAYHYKIEIEIGVGGVVDSLYHIGQSYLQAKAVIRYNKHSDKKVHLYSELEQLKDVYYYPKEYDERIYNYVVIGRAEDAKEVLWKIYRENFEDYNRILCANAKEELRGRLVAVLAMFTEKYDISVEEVQEELLKEQDMMQCFQTASEAIDRIAKTIADRKKDVQQRSALKIMEYIEQNYCDNMLSLKQISQDLGLHENYISRLFRNEYGEYLSDVIEKMRIERACDLIKRTDMKISDIASDVGYSSDASFRRAFKRIVGMSPGEYRD